MVLVAKSAASSRRAIMTVTEDTPFAEADDTYHRLSDDPFEVETAWWSLNVPDRRMGAWLHAAYRPNLGTTTCRVFVWDDRGADPSRLAYYRSINDQPMPSGQDLRDITFPGGGYSLKMLKPLMDYHVGYSDPERGFG